MTKSNAQHHKFTLLNLKKFASQVKKQYNEGIKSIKRKRLQNVTEDRLNTQGQ